jgi:hypothetical protein
MNGLNFSLLGVKDIGEIIFPNGGATIVSKESLKESEKTNKEEFGSLIELEKVVRESIIRTNNSIKKDYTSGAIEKDMQAQEKEVEDKKNEIKEKDKSKPLKDENVKTDNLKNWIGK